MCNAVSSIPETVGLSPHLTVLGSAVRLMLSWHDLTLGPHDSTSSYW